MNLKEYIFGKEKTMRLEKVKIIESFQTLSEGFSGYTLVELESDGTRRTVGSYRGKPGDKYTQEIWD